MYISENRQRLLKYALYHLMAALLLALFGAIYEHFSHQVYSGWMIYAFMIPLGLGTVPFLLMGLRRKPADLLCGMPLLLYNSAVAALAVGSAFQGILEIYGTTNRLIYFYPGLAAVLLITALILLLKDRRKAAKQPQALNPPE